MSDTVLTVLAAVAAALPGLAGVWYSLKVRRDTNEHRATEFGTHLAETAFRNMEAQVQRLSAEQARWDDERDQWHRDRSELNARISALTIELHVTNQYLALLLLALDANGIPRPLSPPGWHPLD